MTASVSFSFASPIARANLIRRALIVDGPIEAGCLISMVTLSVRGKFDSAELITIYKTAGWVVFRLPERGRMR